MADNIEVTAGTGTTIAADEVTIDGATAKVQRVKVSWGVAGSAVDASATNPFPTVQTGALPAGDNNIGNVDIVTLPALPAGTNNIGDVDVLSLPALPAGSNSIGTVVPAGNVAHDAADSGNPVKVGAVARSAAPSAVAAGDRVDLSADTFGSLRTLVVDSAGAALDYTVPALIEGAIAHDGAIGTTKPLATGGRARTSNPTAVVENDATHAMFDKLGKQVVVPALRDLKGVQTTTITSSTSETTIVTAAASTFHDLYGLIIANSSASDTEVAIKDSTAGTTRTTIAVPAGDTRGFMVDAGSAVPQATVNNNWTATCADSVAAILITALYVKNL